MKQSCGCDILEMLSENGVATNDDWYSGALAAAYELSCPELIDWIRVCYGILGHRLNNQNESSIEGFVHLINQIHSTLGKSMKEPLDK